MSRLSGPLLDRIDIQVEVPALSYEELADARPSGPTSEEVRAIVQEARDVQRARYGTAYASNARLDTKALRKWCQPGSGANTLLENAINRLGFSARAYDKVLRLARTLADLDHSEFIGEMHVAEAIQYRTLDRGLI